MVQRTRSFAVAWLAAALLAAILCPIHAETRHSYGQDRSSDGRYGRYRHGRHFRHWGHYRRDRSVRRGEADDFGGDIDEVLSRRDRARRAERIRQAQAHLAALERRVGAKEQARRKHLEALRKAYAHRKITTAKKGALQKK